MRLTLTSLLISVLGSVYLPAYAADTSQSVERIIVKLRATAQPMGVPVSNPSELAARLSAQVQGLTGLALAETRSSDSSWHVLTLVAPVPKSTVQAQLAELAQNPDIEFAVLDERRYSALVPNDPLFTSQNYLNLSSLSPVGLNLPTAWDVTTGNSAVSVAILDTGMLDHLDLTANLVGGKTALSGYDFISTLDEAGDGDGRDSNPTDVGDGVNGEAHSWHGLFVAGIAGAQSNNGMGITGVSWNSPLLNVRVLGRGGGWVSDITDAMRWAAGLSVANVANNPNPAKVINLSLGFSGACNPAEQAAINDVVAQGVTVVVAAGNYNQDASYFSPANCNNVIVVGALDAQGARASYSNFGSRVDVSAAGSLYGLYNTGTTSVGQYSYGLGTGTSFATPLVSSTVALMLSANPKLTDGVTVPRADLPALIKTKLRESARAFPTAAQPSCVVGATATTCVPGGTGIVDAGAAVRAVSTPPVAHAGYDQSVTMGQAVLLNGLLSSDDGSIKRYEWTQIGGSSVTLSNADSVMPSFTAPNQAATLTFALNVVDDVGLSAASPSSVTVSVTNAVTTPTVTPSGSSGGGGSVSLFWLLAIGSGVVWRRCRFWCLNDPM